MDIARFSADGSMVCTAGRDATFLWSPQGERLHRPQGDELTRWKYQRYIKDYLRSVQIESQ